MKKGTLDRLVARIKAAKALNRQDISNDQKIEKASIPLCQAGYKFNPQFLRNLIGLPDKK